MLNPQNTSCEYGTVFCDWLDITFSDLANSCSDFVDYFLDLKFEVMPSKLDVESYSLACFIPRGFNDISRGILKVTNSRGIIRVSLSGVCLEYLRLNNAFLSTLDFFCERPHHITRLDSALDLDIVGFKRIKDLRSKFPDVCALSSRTLRTKSILSRGLDGRQTGTFYVGHSSTANATARCYDKRHQVWETTGFDLGFNVFRYEIVNRFKRDRGGASLKDVADPTSLFYHHASVELLRRPKGVSDWVKSSAFTFTPEKIEPALPAQKIKSLVSDSYLLGRIARLIQEKHSGGLDYAVTVIEKELVRVLDLDAEVTRPGQSD